MMNKREALKLKLGDIVLDTTRNIKLEVSINKLSRKNSYDLIECKYISSQYGRCNINYKELQLLNEPKKIVLSEFESTRLWKVGELYFIALNSRTMVDATGTKDEIIAELKRWKKDIDFNNEYMLNLENQFIQALENEV